MKRFYTKCMKILDSREVRNGFYGKEIHDDISDYVNYLEHKNSVLVSVKSGKRDS